VEKGKMKICLYSPYVPKHVGGGEKYFFDVARVCKKMGHEVFVAVSGERELSTEEVAQVRQQYEAFLGESLSDIQFIITPIGTDASFFTKLWWTRQFDVLYYITDGSLFFSLAKKNILHIQIPFTDKKSSLIERIKLANWRIKNTNSEFTKKIIETHWQTHIQYTHYPMIEREGVNKIRQKQNILLHVGRFFRHQHSKRQDILVSIFQTLLKKHPQQTKNWKLVLVGSIEDESYAMEVQEMSKGLPIEIFHDVTRKELWEWYERAKIYWHATGFGIDELAHPEKVEHFGISTVEAMLSACVPIVIGKGGQVEILGKELEHLLWLSEEECVAKTMMIIEDQNRAKFDAQLAKSRAQQFNQKRFHQTLQKMLE
jgi:glycosyltransferase involved in cell wall biosynthesis